jgi:hypothetical protein
MHNNFINNLKDYLYTITDGKFNLFDYATEEDKNLTPIHFLFKCGERVDKNTSIGGFLERLFVSLYYIEKLEEEKKKDPILLSIAKERKNIKSILKSITAIKNIFEIIGDEKCTKKLKIIKTVFDMLEKDDWATIELVCTASFLFSIIESGDATFALVESMAPNLTSIVMDAEELAFLASLMHYFDGYRLTPEMLLHSLAIKLFNYHRYLTSQNNNKLGMARLVENLLAPFSKTEKFRVLPKRAENFYIKSRHKGLYVLAYSGKKDKSMFAHAFNPEKFFEVKSSSHPLSGEDLQTEINNSKLLIFGFYSTIILSR